MKIKTKDMIFIKVELIKVKRDKIYEFFPWNMIYMYMIFIIFKHFFSNLSNLLNYYLHLY